MTDDSSIKPLSSIIKRIKKKYDEDEEGWKVHGGLDGHNNRDLLISQKPNLWWLKSKPIDPYRSISYGQELKNVDLTDIDEKIASEAKNTMKSKNKALHSIFGMSVPVSDQEMINAMGIARIAPKEMQTMKSRVQEKYPNSEKNLKKKVKKKWEKEYPQRDNIFL